MENRRQFARLKVDDLESKCKVKGTGSSLDLEIYDLSPNGIGFISSKSILEGQELDVVLKLEDESISCKARVCWIKADVIDRRMTVGGMRLLVSNLHEQSKLLVSYTNRLLEDCPLPQNFAL